MTTNSEQYINKNWYYTHFQFHVLQSLAHLLLGGLLESSTSLPSSFLFFFRPVQPYSQVLVKRRGERRRDSGRSWC